ncbi:MAG: hypothetical protein AAF432_10010 [Planctomycetota bacterium]
MYDEGPSEEDIRRFDRDSAYCPECGAEVWDGVDVCPTCREFVGGRLTSSPKTRLSREMAQRTRLVLVLLLVAMIGFGWIVVSLIL